MPDDAKTPEPKTPELDVTPPLEPQPGIPAEPRGLEGSGLKFGDDAPEYARGKTADELLEMTQTLYQTMQNTNFNATPAPTPVPVAPVQPVPAAPVGGPPDPALIYTDAPEYQRQMATYIQTSQQAQNQLQAQPLFQSNAEMAKLESQRNPLYANVWKRYGPMIEAEAAPLPLQMKTSPKFWNDAAALIKGRHSEDIFKDRLAASNTDTGTMSVDGSVSAPSQGFASPVEKAWQDNADWILQFKRLPGMTLSKIRERIQTLGHTEESYVKHYESKLAMKIHRSDEELAQHGVAS